MLTPPNISKFFHAVYEKIEKPFSNLFFSKRYDLNFPKALLVKVGDKTTALENTSAIQNDDPASNILFWVDRDEKDHKILANTLAKSPHIPKRRIFSVIEANRQKIFTKNMYEFIHNGASALCNLELSKQNNLIIIINPTNSLAILSSMCWPNTKSLCVINRDDYISADILKNCDCIVATKSAFEALSKLDGFPLLLSADDDLDFSAAIKSFIQSTKPAASNYFYSIRGRALDLSQEKLSSDNDLIFVGCEVALAQSKNYSTFQEFMTECLKISEDVLINSRWIYQYENLFAGSKWADVIKRVVRRGGNVKFLDKVS